MTSEPCRISTGTEAGHPAVYLDSDVLHICVLPEKGADIYKFIYKPIGIDVLWKNPVGLYPPGAPPHDGWGDLEFMRNYEGTWQELFPSHNDPTTYNGKPIPFHGEVATLPWTYTIEEASDDRIAVRFTVETRQTTFRLERLMRLERGSAQLTLDETVTNIGQEDQHFVWGHHCVVGGMWLEAGCKLDIPAKTIITSPNLYEEKTARLAPGQREPWPQARLRTGDTVDLSIVPGPEIHTHDEMYITDLTGGWVAVTNPRIGLTFSLNFDPNVFKWVISWQPYGGAEAPPFKNMSYSLGIEPWVNNKALGESAADGTAIQLAPGETFSTSVYAQVTRG